MTASPKGHKRGTSLICLIAILLSIASLPAAINAREFTVTKVDTLGEINSQIGNGPMKFSPSGDQLAAYSGSTLVLTDVATLAQRKIITLEKRTIQFDWSSDSEIVVLERLLDSFPDDCRRLIQIDIHTGQTKALHEYCRKKHPNPPETEPILSLKKTVNGQFIYKLWPLDKITRGGSPESDRGAITVIPPTNYPTAESEEDPAIDYYIEWDQPKDGLFKISLDNCDSIKIGPYFAIHHLFPPVYSKDLKYVMSTRKILKVDDGTFINPEELISVPDDMDGCSFFWSEFNPVFSDELMFKRECFRVHNEKESYSYFAGMLDLTGKTVTTMADLTGIENCHLMTYSPDGLNIAVVSDGVAYLVRREPK